MVIDTRQRFCNSVQTCAGSAPRRGLGHHGGAPASWPTACRGPPSSRNRDRAGRQKNRRRQARKNGEPLTLVEPARSSLMTEAAGRSWFSAAPMRAHLAEDEVRTPERRGQADGAAVTTAAAPVASSWELCWSRFAPRQAEEALSPPAQGARATSPTAAGQRAYGRGLGGPRSSNLRRSLTGSRAVQRSTHAVQPRSYAYGSAAAPKTQPRPSRATGRGRRWRQVSFGACLTATDLRARLRLQARRSAARPPL